MANVNPPKKNQAWSCDIFLEDLAVAGSFKSSPTLASGDFKVSKDNGAQANLATLPTVSPAAGVIVSVVLSATEMNADKVTIVGIDQTTPKEWADFAMSILTTA